MSEEVVTDIGVDLSGISVLIPKSKDWLELEECELIMGMGTTHEEKCLPVAVTICGALSENFLSA